MLLDAQDLLERVSAPPCQPVPAFSCASGFGRRHSPSSWSQYRRAGSHHDVNPRGA
jgi:hypothetical protein